MNRSLSKSISGLSKSFQQNSPVILTGLGVAGVLTSVIMAVKATPKALEILEQEDRYRQEATDSPDFDKPLTFPEKVALTWQVYLPTAIMSASTIACIIGSNVVSLRRNAALISVLSLTETAMKEYQEKVVKTLGEKKEENIRAEIAQDKLNANPLEGQAVIVTKNGSMLCYDTISGRYFYSDVESIRQIQNDFNKRLLSELSISLNELYFALGLDAIEIGNHTGWDVTKGKGFVDMFFGAKLTRDGQPCIVIEHRNLPTSIWS